MIANQAERRAIHQDHGRTVETVMVSCTACGNTKKVRCDHRASDAAIRKRHFGRWTIKGCFGAKRTRCPNCINR